MTVTLNQDLKIFFGITDLPLECNECFFDVELTVFHLFFIVSKLLMSGHSFDVLC